MKYPFSILLAVVTLLSSCVDYDFKNDAADGKSAVLQVSAATYAATDNQTLGEAEYVIKRARLYAFDGDVLDNMVYKDNIDANNLGSLLMEIKVKQTASKTLYLIINEPDDAEMHSRLALINNPAAFETLEYEMASYFNQSTQKAFNSITTNFAKDKFCLPMFGKLENINAVTTSSSAIEVSMAAIRSLARVDVMVQKGTDVNPNIKIDSQTKISISNTRSRGYIAGVRTAPADALTSPADAATGTATALNVPTKAASGNDNAVLAFTFYTPERECTTSKLGFTLSNVDFGAKRMNFDVTIGDQENNPLTKIERNKVHKIYCTFTQKTTDVEIKILDWSDISITGDISGSEFAVSQSKVVMDWWNLGKKFDTSVSFTSSENVTFTAGDYYTKNSDGTFSKISLPSWLNVAMSTLPAKTGNITLTYNITNKDHSDVYIKLKSGNLTKYIRVVYDNGYLPYSILTANGWSTNTPSNGVHLAKRSNVIPSAEASSAELSNSWYGTTDSGVGSVSMNAGYGYGMANTEEIVSKMTVLNAYAAFTCHNIGVGWYLPSYRELIATSYSLKAYLGQSYIMQDSWFWSSSKYNSTNVYAVSPTNGSYQSFALNTKNAIRCIKNFGISLETTSLTADYVNWGNSFTKKIKFTSEGELTIKSINNSGSYRNWISSVTINGTTSGTIDITYAPTTGYSGSHYSVTITVQDGASERTITVSYDNGIIPRSALYSSGWSSNLPTVGLQIARKSTETWQRWSNPNNSGWVYGARNYGFGTGLTNTYQAIATHGGNAYAAYRCRNELNGWYVPSAYELTKLATTWKYYLGSSYNSFYVASPSTNANYYWTSTQYENLNYDAIIVDMSSGSRRNYDKSQFQYLRCVKNY